MPSNNLIIKLGAMGDVVRTTPLLHVLDGENYWVTRKECLPLLPLEGPFIKKIIDIDKAGNSLSRIDFNLIISLDDELPAAALASSLKKTELIGSFLNSQGKVEYTDSAAEWFDMGLISKLGKEKADNLKKKNERVYQDILFGMLGKEFHGEEYILNFKRKNNNRNEKKILIGIEGRANKRWPTKQWNKYDQLGKELSRDGFDVKFFQQRGTIDEYVNDISECGLIVTGDTLALHIALALKIKGVAIFTCTSPAEIFDYGRMIKVISPLWKDSFYSAGYAREAVEAVSLDSVYKTVVSMSRQEKE